MVPWTAHGRMKSAPADLGDRSFAPGNLGRSQQSLLDCWAIAGFHEETLGDRRLLLGAWAIAESLLDCCLVAPFAPWSPLMLSGRPLCSLVAPYAVWSPLLQSGRPL